jgi:molybdenum cofactor synthesis domain-containing protein
MPNTAGIIIIGNEILSGKVQDANSPYLCRELRFLGVELCRIITIPDELEVIAQYVREYSEAYTWVFTSGGIGPTHDDVTIESAAAAFGRKLISPPRLEELVRSFYGDDTNEAHLRMARIPEGGELIDTPPLRTPLLLVENVFVFPGVPELLKNRFSLLKERFQSDPIHLRQIYLSANEGQIADVLNKTLDTFPELMLGSYPALWNKDYKVRLTLESRSESYLDTAFSHLQARLPQEEIVRVE